MKVDFTQSVADKFGFIPAAVHDGRGDHPPISSINYRIYEIAVFLVYKFGIGGILQDLVILFQGSGQDGIAQLADNLQDNIVIRDSDSHSFTFLLDGFGNLRTGSQNKGKGTRHMRFHQFEGPVIHLPGIIGEVTQIGTDEGELSFFRLNSLNSRNPLHSPGLCNVAPDSIDRIGGVNNHSPIPKQLYNFVDLLLIRILFI